MTVQAIQRISAGQSPQSKTTDPSRSGGQFKDIARDRSAKRATDRPERKGHDKQTGQSANKHATSHHGGLLAQPDGSFIVGQFSSPGPAVPRATVRATQHAPAPALDSGALQNVKVGQAGGTVRLHATLGHGPHRGVELRAIETHGKVQVELIAQDPHGARSLRADLGEIRELLSKRGLESVEITVTTQSDRSAESGVERSSASANTGQPPEQDNEATAEDDEQNHLHGVRQKRSAQLATQSQQDTADVVDAWEIL